MFSVLEILFINIILRFVWCFLNYFSVSIKIRFDVMGRIVSLDQLLYFYYFIILDKLFDYFGFGLQGEVVGLGVIVSLGCLWYGRICYYCFIVYFVDFQQLIGEVLARSLGFFQSQRCCFFLKFLNYLGSFYGNRFGCFFFCGIDFFKGFWFVCF